MISVGGVTGVGFPEERVTPSRGGGGVGRVVESRGGGRAEGLRYCFWVRSMGRFFWEHRKSEVN